jgi:hypothetical protein
MCIVPSEGCTHQAGSSGSVSETLDTALIVIAGTATVAAAYAAFRVLWVPIGLAILVGWLVAYPAPRRVARVACRLVAVGLVGLVAAAVWLYRHRRPAPAPSRAVAVPREYRATLYRTTPAGNRVLRRGPVPGLWTDPATVAAEIHGRYLAQYEPVRPHEIRCHVEPVPDGVS